MSVVLDDLVGAPRFEAVSELDRLEAIAAGVARTAWADRAKTGLGDDLVQLSRIERMVGAAKLGALAAFDASGQYRFDAQPSAATWMAAKTKADRRRVRHQIGVARKARTMPLTEDAYRNGWIAFEHVATLSRAVNANTEVFFAEAEAELVAAARTLDFDLFVRAVRAWMDFVDPDGAEERARKADERRRAHASRTFDGMVRIDAWLDAIGGTDQIDDEATEDVEDEADLDDDLDTDDLDPAETGAVDPDEHTTETAGPRPLPDRWKAIDLRPGAGLADTRFYDIMSELEDCTPIVPRVAISLGLAGTIRRVVFGPDSHILDFGQAVDYFHGPLREAVIIRDRFCRDEGCGLPGRDSQIDHVIPRRKGGPTAESNGECKCGTANRLKGDRMP